jgi:hypothetical protein
MTASESPAQDTNAGSSVASVQTERRSEGCGCTQCVGVYPAPLTQVVAPQSIPDTFAELVGGPLTDNREPLVPPPQVSSIG